MLDKKGKKMNNDQIIELLNSLSKCFNPDLILGILTLILSIIAICISLYQNHLNIKLNLFDRKMRIFLNFQEIIDLYAGLLEIENQDNLDTKEKLAILTPSSIVENIPDLLSNPLKIETKKLLLIEYEKGIRNGEEIRLLSNKKNEMVYELIRTYFVTYYYVYNLLYTYYCQNKKETNNINIKQEFEKLDLIYKEIIENNIIEKFKKSIKIL